jgi:hypothetical protein
MSHRYRSQNETRVPRLHSPGQGVIGSSARSPLAHDLLCAAPQAYHRISRLEHLFLCEVLSHSA